MSRLWDKGEPLDQVIERFTVGRDPELDLRLVHYDALSSAAHATMLCEIEILTEADKQQLIAELKLISEEALKGEFPITRSDEDGHTAIENRLTERLGDVGRRIHTGRSRNDQVIAAIRLYGREMVLKQYAALLTLVDALLLLADKEAETSIPGYTHTRQAMPSTLGFLFAAHAENLLDDIPWLENAFGHINRSPLGSASGFGVSLPLDRARVCSLLAFDSLQLNTIAVQNDRGKTESLVLGAAAAPALDLSRLAGDLVWYSSDELNFMTLHNRVTTGSSIMPQKRNPDVLELIRASAQRIRSRQAEISAVYSPLSSGYHRDLQLTKEPFLEGMQLAVDCLQAMLPVLESLTINADSCRQAMNRAIGATDEVYRRVAEGTPFRSAYQEIAADPIGTVKGDPADAWRQRTHLGAPGALDLSGYRERVARAKSWLDVQGQKIETAWSLFSD
jgi:argininosuccinate lyase